MLGGTLEEGLAGGEVTLAADGGPGRDETVVRYYDHELPVRPGTEDLPLAELVDRQWWRLESWRAADEHLNYRRFFDVGTLAAVRVEDPEVFDATHALLVDLVREGSVDGLRIDHPDGLADPRGYLRRLAERDRRRLGRRGEDPRRRRAAARGLAVRRHHRVRPALAGRRPVRRPGR